MSSKSSESRCQYQPNYSYNLIPHCQQQQPHPNLTSSSSSTSSSALYSHNSSTNVSNGCCQLNDSKHLIRCTFVIILSILLLLISVSGFFILLISNDSTIFYPYTQPVVLSDSFGSSGQHNHHAHSQTATSNNNNFLFYTSTIFQLTLIIIEVLIALVIIFICECDSSIEPSAFTTGSTAATYFNYNELPSNCGSPPTSIDNNGRQLTRRLSKATPTTNSTGSCCAASRCNSISALRIVFIILVCVSFVLRFVTSSWGSIFLSNDSSSPASSSSSPSSSSMSKLVGSTSSGNSYFNGVIYLSTLLELILFLLVLTTTAASGPVSSTIRLVSSSR